MSIIFWKSIFRSTDRILLSCRKDKDYRASIKVSVILRPCTKVDWFLEVSYGSALLRRSSRSLVMDLGIEESTLTGRKSSMRLDPQYVLY
jgi:hypothetical protein